MYILHSKNKLSAPLRAPHLVALTIPRKQDQLRRPRSVPHSFKYHLFSVTAVGGLGPLNYVFKSFVSIKSSYLGAVLCLCAQCDIFVSEEWNSTGCMRWRYCCQVCVVLCFCVIIYCFSPFTLSLQVLYSLFSRNENVCKSVKKYVGY